MSVEQTVSFDCLFDTAGERLLRPFVEISKKNAESRSHKFTDAIVDSESVIIADLRKQCTVNINCKESDGEGLNTK